MAIIRWKQPREIFAMQDEMNRIFENMLGNYGGADGTNGLHPLSDISENKDGFAVTVELPGMKREDIKITLHNNSITISGEKKKVTESKDETIHRVERSYGSFSRTFEIPGVVDATKIKAEFKDGILTVQLPKAEESKPKEISILVK